MRRQPRNSFAIVLRQVVYGESDLIVSLLTSDCGLVRGFARGGRKSVKRFGSALSPFARIDLCWQPGKGELLTLLGAELIDARQGLRQSLEQLALAGYAVELLEMLLHEGEEQSPLYALLDGYLDYLAGGGSPAQARLLFELRLVEQLGYIPHLLHCSECFVQFDQGEIAFDSTRGGSLCASCADRGGLQVALGTLGSLSRSLRTPIGLFDGFHLGERTLREGAAMLASVLHSMLPRPPKSLRFLPQAAGPGEP